MNGTDTDTGTLENSMPGTQWPKGVRVVLYELLSGTNDYGVEMVQALCKVVPLTVITVDNTKLPLNLSCKVMPVVPAFAKPVSRLRKFTAMARAYCSLVQECLRSPRRTILHIEFLRFERFEALLFGLLQRLGVTLIYSAHNALPHDQLPWHPTFYRRWYQRVDAVHVLSRSVLDAIQSKVGAQPKKFCLAGHGPYDGLKQTYSHLSSPQERLKRGIPEDAFVVLQYGLFKTYKGLDILVEAANELGGTSKIFLVLAGAGPIDYLNCVENQLLNGQLKDRHLWYRKFVSDRDLCELITLADVVVFPYKKVSQSGALFLALTFEKAVLCSDLPGFRENLPDQDLFFFEVGAAHRLAQRLAEIESNGNALNINRDLIAKMRRTGFDWATIALQMKCLYRDAYRH